MEDKAKLVKQVLYLLQSFDGREIELKDVEMIEVNGIVSGANFKIVTISRPELKLVKGEEDS